MINSGDTVYQIFSTPQLTSDVQGRLNNTLNNNGWMFLGSSEGVAGTARRFSSTEVTGLGIASALTPRIIVDYTISAIPEPSSAVALGIIGAFAATMRRRKA